MTGNILYEPLGQDTPKPPVRPRWPKIAAGAVAGAAAVGALFVWVRESVGPHPDVRIVAVLPMPDHAAVLTPAPPVAPLPVAKPTVAAAVVRTSDEVDQASGVHVVRPPGSSGAGAAFIAIPPSEALTPAPDPRLVEKSRFGLLPRRGADGSRAAEVYARPVSPGVDKGRPRLALFVGGMGLNAQLTRVASQSLPPEVTLGFAPYGNDLDRQVADARELGHETILQVPMESFSDSDGSTMPRMLSADVGAKQTLEDLHWHMSRFVGYAGVSNFLGAKFTADAQAFTPVLREVGARGLFFIDDGSAARSLAMSLATVSSTTVVRADVMIDALGEPATIEAALKKLAAQARERGLAVGATTGLPTTVDVLAAFLKGLPAQGIILVPISSLAQESKSGVSR